MLVEGEEEVGSRNLMSFFKQYKKRIQSDVIVVCDTENIEVGVPSITYALRGIVAARVEVQSAKLPVHSGMSGGIACTVAISTAGSGWCMRVCSICEVGCGRSTVRKSAPQLAHSSSPSRFFAPQLGQMVAMIAPSPAELPSRHHSGGSSVL